MAYRLSRQAEADLFEIGAYTLQTWGTQQARQYLEAIEAACEGLASSALARPCDDLYPGMRRLRTPGKHLIFFLLESGGSAFVVRILHERMDFAAHMNWDD